MGSVERPARSSGAVRWGILATGHIARQFTADLQLNGHRVLAVGSRSGEAANRFAADLEVPRAHGSYEDLAADPDVDVIYVATPHSSHAEFATLAIEHGKHVLVEKAFTRNAEEAREVVGAAQASGVVVMEAMWTRFLPHMSFVRKAVRSGKLGEIRWVHADHTQQLPDDPTHRLNAPELAGGALLDLGVYPLSFAHDLLGPPTAVSAYGTLKGTGVDASVGTLLQHRGGAVSTSYVSSVTRGPNAAVVLGSEGRIDIDAVWYNPSRTTRLAIDGTVVETFDAPIVGRGMHFQALEMERVLAAGESFSPLMPPEDSIEVMTTMDTVRRQIGVRYPGEIEE